MQRLLSHAVTELGETRRSHKISKQGTYPSYLYPKEVGEGGGAVPTWPDYYLNNLYPSISLMWEVGGEPSHCNALAVYSRSWQDIFLHISTLHFYLYLYLIFIFSTLTCLFFILSLNFLWIIWQDIFLYILELYRIFISSIHIKWIIWQYLC